LWAVSLHLLTRSAAARDAEAHALVSLLAQNVPAGDWVVLAGDLNTGSRQEAALATLSAAVVTSGPWPTDGAGDGDTNATRSKPYDWVLVSPNLASHAVPTVIGQSVFSSGLVADTRVYSPIQELAPALASDSAAIGMQHMAVVRDFSLSTDPKRLPQVHLDSPNGADALGLGSSVEVRWTTRDVGAVDVEYAADGVNFTTVAAGVAASTGGIAWTVPAPATTVGVLRVHSSTDAEVSDMSDAPLQVVSPPHVIINEVLANESGTATGGEFIEVYNAGGSPANLSGWTLSDAALVRHTFGNTTLAPGATLVVFAGASFIPSALTNAVAASTGSLALNNGGDSVTLTNAGQVIDTVTYAAALAALDGVSMNRSPDRTDGPWALHSSLSSPASSPGLSVTGAP
jgi:hypothetical protein